MGECIQVMMISMAIIIIIILTIIIRPKVHAHVYKLSACSTETTIMLLRCLSVAIVKEQCYHAWEGECGHDSMITLLSSLLYFTMSHNNVFSI